MWKLPLPYLKGMPLAYHGKVVNTDVIVADIVSPDDEALVGVSRDEFQVHTAVP